ncbi:MAG: hypothetical protein NPIRA02_13180 [Nitrospirales bacterium]|nr:MAG: hypothetical protein NPIRA02_13180 [Nitrospirales bacterium]
MRLVLNTNILVSELLSQTASPVQLLQRWLEGCYELAASQAQVDELTRVLAHNKLQTRIPADHAADLRAILGPWPSSCRTFQPLLCL